MKQHFFQGVAALLAACCLTTGCATRDIENPNPNPLTQNGTEPFYQLEIPDIHTQETKLYAEAEACDLFGSLHTAADRPGFAGTGYVTGFDKSDKNQIIADFTVPSTQHYDITLCAAADKDVTNAITVNSSEVGEFTLQGTGEFTRVTYHGVFIPEGQAKISIAEQDGSLDLDYIEIKNNTSLYEIDYDAAADTPVNKGASAATKQLMKFLAAHYGKETLTGQYCSSPDNKEIELICSLTGQSPVIRFGDLGSYSNDQVEDAKEIEAAIKWGKEGGVVGYMWYWTAPMGKSTVYAKESDFSLKACMTSCNIAGLNMDDLEVMCQDGAISEECVALVKSMDEVATQLKRLKKENIPVLFRPLHEAGGGWYWWGSDGADAYKWLWNLIYTRFTEYYELDNLIWIWNGQNPDYYVGSSLYDIASIDVYLSKDAEYDSRSGQFQWIYALTKGKKMVALSECSTIPDVDSLVRDKAVWSFFGLWYGEYLMKPDGTFSDAYTKQKALVKAYNCDATLNLHDYTKFRQEDSSKETQTVNPQP